MCYSCHKGFNKLLNYSEKYGEKHRNLVVLLIVQFDLEPGAIKHNFHHPLLCSLHCRYNFMFQSSKYYTPRDSYLEYHEHSSTAVTCTQRKAGKETASTKYKIFHKMSTT